MENVNKFSNTKYPSIIKFKIVGMTSSIGLDGVPRADRGMNCRPCLEGFTDLLPADAVPSMSHPYHFDQNSQNMLSRG
jgi:hypothetical protein